MSPNILPGDRILSLNFLYNFRLPFSEKSSFQMANPKYGDIIFFRSPVEDKIYVKRVIGLPGDVITFQNGEIRINNQIISGLKVHEEQDMIESLEEMNGKQYKIQKRQVSLTSMHNQQYAIPEKKLFVLGDSRDKSYDSRHFGYLPIDFVIGKAICIIFSTDGSSSKILPKFRENRFLKSI
jgi:signal peptidase I